MHQLVGRKRRAAVCSLFWGPVRCAACCRSGGRAGGEVGKKFEAKGRPPGLRGPPATLPVGTSDGRCLTSACGALASSSTSSVRSRRPLKVGTEIGRLRAAKVAPAIEKMAGIAANEPGRLYAAIGAGAGAAAAAASGFGAARPQSGRGGPPSSPLAPRIDGRGARGNGEWAFGARARVCCAREGGSRPPYCRVHEREHSYTQEERPQSFKSAPKQ